MLGAARRLPARPGIRKTDLTVTIGPSPVDGYLVHDFLDYNLARVEVEDRRAKERTKKAGQRGQARLPWDDLKTDVPGGHASMSPGLSPLKGDTGYGCGEVPPPGEDRSSDACANARSSDPGVQEVLDVLVAAPRLHVDAVGVENAIRAFPSGDPVKAAREVVTLGTDPAYRLTNAARLLWRSLQDQTAPPRGQVAQFGRGRSWVAELQALKGGAA
jgi:hypothetical protein